ncbi:MAG: sodium/proton-translocating pyrophosphatase, partial [Planctomycetales bacterium]|nr:sodium/proton-translocating pyrophosphatase [Planctomycetales bacterium]
ATIADNVGDNVGDVAGMGADLYESYCGSILATAALGVAAFSTPALLPDGMTSEIAQLKSLFLPMAIAGVGIFLSILGIYMVRTQEDATQKNLLAALGRGINLSTILVVVAAVVLAKWLMPAVEGTLIAGIPGVAFSVIVGLAAGWLIGKWTEYATSDEYAPTKNLAEQALTGPATIIIGGIADGMMSVWFPVIVVCGGTLAAFGFAAGWSNVNEVSHFALGLYGVGIAAVGMLSTLGITLATDAYGPIADNAGGNAEMSHLEPIVRQRTDALDSLGNTTAATGKGFAIGSAALTALALLAAYVEEVRVGFERWGEAVVKTVDEDGFYKVSAGFVVEKHGDEAHTYLFMPDDRRDERLKDAWEGIDFRSGPVLIPSEMIEHTHGEEAEGEMHAPVRLAIAGGPAGSGPALIDMKLATLPDFTTYYDASLMNPKVLVGVFLGAMATFVFCAMTMKAVGRAAASMVGEVRRQFRSIAGIMDFKPGDMSEENQARRPDYDSCVAIATRGAQREMLLPSIIAVAVPVLIGLVFGVAGVVGLLAGSLAGGFLLAIMMSNAGGAWD